LQFGRILYYKSMPTLAQSCVAHYKMNDNAANTTVLDSSGNGYNGTAQRNTSILHTDGKVNGAISFNGTSDYINTNATFQLVLQSDFILNIWCKPTNLAADGSQILFGVISSFGGVHYMLEFYITTDDVTQELMWAAEYGDHYSDNEARVSAGEPTEDWTMTTLIVKKISETLTQAFLYINNVLIDSSDIVSFDMNSFVVNQNVYIGDINWQGTNEGEWFNGPLDNAMIFNRALTEDEIATLWNGGAGTEDLSGADTVVGATINEGWAF
jgi:hypothetical protein